jgi:hypothetical protein
MQTSIPAPPGQPWYAQRWPWLLMLGPAIVIVAGIHTTWVAFTMQDALVVDDYYMQGKAINQDLRRERTAAAMGLRAQLRYDAARGMLAGQLSGKLTPANLPIKLQLIHSTLPEKDIRLSARTDANGAFEIALPIFDKARWQVMLEDDGTDWRLSGPWLWPAQRDVALGVPASQGGMQ